MQAPGSWTVEEIYNSVLSPVFQKAASTEGSKLRDSATGIITFCSKWGWKILSNKKGEVIVSVNHVSHDNAALRGGLGNTAKGVLNTGVSWLQSTEFKKEIKI